MTITNITNEKKMESINLFINQFEDSEMIKRSSDA
jgi:hypothetical protein